MKGWVQPLGVSDVAGSFIASITIVVLIALVVFYFREGRAAEGSYWHAAAWFAAFAVWSQALIITGIFITARTGAATYYEEMMGNHLKMPPVQHMLAHSVAAVVLAIAGMVLGAPIYFLAKRGRPKSSASSALKS
jgi:hypothetical protein